MKLNKKGFSLIKYPIALLFFSLFVVGGYLAFNPGSGAGFWAQYDYSPTSANNLSQGGPYDKISDLGGRAEDIACDLNPESESCPEVKSSSGEESNFVQRMLQGGYATMVTLYKMFSVPKLLINSVLSEIGVPTIVANVLYYALLFVVVISITLIIFNRGEVA